MRRCLALGVAVRRYETGPMAGWLRATARLEPEEGRLLDALEGGHVMSRSGTAERTTAETEIRVRIDLDGTGRVAVETPIGFLDHLLTLLRAMRRRPPGQAGGDAHVDEHGTATDGLVLGGPIDAALGERAASRSRCPLPMDEALALCAVDLGGRAVSDIEPRPDPLAGGNVWLELWPHFVETLAREARASVHLEVRKARSTHHLVEGGVKSACPRTAAGVGAGSEAGGCRRHSRRRSEQQGHAAVIAVVDFGSGNTRSVLRALEAVGAEARLVATPEGIDAADRVVLPGVGAAPSAVEALMARWPLGAGPTMGRRRPSAARPVPRRSLLLEGSDEGDAPGSG